MDPFIKTLYFPMTGSFDLAIRTALLLRGFRMLGNSTSRKRNAVFYAEVSNCFLLLILPYFCKLARVTSNQGEVNVNGWPLLVLYWLVVGRTKHGSEKVIVF